jgi:hypothetical protein
VVIPFLYWPSFFLFTGLVEQQTLGQVGTTLYQRLPDLMKARVK